ncbi:MAG: O-antigen ligase family protein [Bacteroidales bacterium]|nr:O-antigen ligase family protein [Bacteroidales bacterium]
MLGDKIHRYVYIFFLSGIAFFLPVSVFMTSAFIIALVINWLLDKNSWRHLKWLPSNKPLLVFLLIYLLYIIFMLNTGDTYMGIMVLKLKLPLLAIPLVVATSASISMLEKRIILSSFILGVFVASVSGIVYYFIIADGIPDRRDISLFISHIRLSLMVCFSFFISSYYTLIHDELDFRFKYVYVQFALWFLFFLLVLMSYTGIIIFVIVMFYSSYRITRRSGNRHYEWINIAVTAILLLALSTYLGYRVKDFYTIMEDGQPDYSAMTAGNRPYVHDTGKDYLENGYYVWRYICESELRPAWNKRSTLDYDAVDLKKQDIKHTLIRYMTSLGLKKDSLGVSSLSEKDVDIIEAGYANSRYKDGININDRVYELIWQLDYYFKGGNPQGHSVTQRIEFFLTGWRVFKRHPLFGTGTGDLEDEFRKQYKADDSALDSEHRFISHNQYLTVLITFGLIGFIIFMHALFYPVIKMRGFRDYLFAVFFIIIMLSMLNEDTMETHTGITLFSLFYSLFIFGRPEK